HPVRKTKRMPASAARSGTRGRPPFGFDGSAGSGGSRIFQSRSGTICITLPLHLHLSGIYNSTVLQCTLTHGVFHPDDIELAPRSQSLQLLSIARSKAMT